MLGKLIKTYINFKGFKQTVIARKSGLSPQSLNDILNERRRIEATEYFSICKALGVSTEYFEKLLNEATQGKGERLLHKEPIYRKGTNNVEEESECL